MLICLVHENVKIILNLPISRSYCHWKFEDISDSRIRNIVSNTPIPLDGVSATIRNFGQNDTKRGRNAKSAAETPRAQ